MTDFTALALAQVQFLGGLGFHQAFLALAVALAWLLCGMKWRARQAAAWMPAYRFWVRFFALAWVLAFASGLPVLFQAGSLWPGLGERVGNVAGPLLAAIVLTVFLFKTCFLGVMLFGQMRVSARVHALSVFMTAMGLTLTLFWELALLAWTHAPVGSTWFNGQYYVDDWRTLLFDGLAPWMMLRVLAGGFFAVACLMTGISAWQSLRRELSESETRVCRLGIWMALASLLAWGAALLAQVPLLAAWQPVQLAALAGLWESGSESAFLLFAWAGPGGAGQSGRMALGRGRLALAGAAGRRHLGGAGPGVGHVAAGVGRFSGGAGAGLVDAGGRPGIDAGFVDGAAARLAADVGLAGGLASRAGMVDAGGPADAAAFAVAGGNGTLALFRSWHHHFCRSRQ